MFQSFNKKFTEIKNLKKYLIYPNLKLKNIVDKDTDNAYFCFSGAVKNGWEELITDCQNIQEVELELETNERGNNKVVSLFAIKDREIIA